jgi:hypothetical protein
MRKAAMICRHGYLSNGTMSRSEHDRPTGAISTKCQPAWSGRATGGRFWGGGISWIYDSKSGSAVNGSTTGATKKLKRRGRGDRRERAVNTKSRRHEGPRRRYKRGIHSQSSTFHERLDFRVVRPEVVPDGVVGNKICLCVFNKFGGRHVAVILDVMVYQIGTAVIALLSPTKI